MWSEIQSAAEVARLGTISGAAAALGIHRATINRHIDALERDLGAKLFRRHARGYVPTDLGTDLLRIANTTTEQMEHLRAQAEGRSDHIGDELVITAVDVIAPLLMAAIEKFKTQYPAVRTKFFSSQSLSKLEYGEADIAFRLGPKPNDPDNVVTLYKQIQMGLFASKSYVARNGLPSEQADISAHHFIGTAGDAERAPFTKWLSDIVSEKQVTFIANQTHIMELALRAGIGIGFAPIGVAESDEDLVAIRPSNSDWQVPLWIVTHVDLHRSVKVQAFISML